MRHEPPKGFKAPEKPPASLLAMIGPEHEMGPIKASADHLQKLADLYEQWVAVYRYAGDRFYDAEKAGDVEIASEARVSESQALRRMAELIDEICDCPAQTIADLGRKARVLREHARDWWREREEPLARSLCHDALRLAEMAAPQMPDFSPQEMLERILPAEASRVAS